MKKNYSNINLFSDLTIRSIIIIITFWLVINSVLAPILQHFYGYPYGENIYHNLSRLCHQYPTRSLWIFNRPFALCTRCTFLYLGLFVASAFWILNITYKKKFVIGVMLIMIVSIDPIVQLLTSYESTNFIRAITGFVGGLGAFLIVNFISTKKG